MALTLSGTNGVVGAGFTVDASGVSVTAGVGTFSSVQGSGANLTSLPAANLTGALPAISAASCTSIPAANIVGLATAGFERSGGFGGGKVLQVVEGTSDTTVTSTSSEETLLTISITPASSSNKVLVVATTVVQAVHNTNAKAWVQVYRGTSSDTRILNIKEGTNAAVYDYCTISGQKLDSPNTSSAQTYTMTIARLSGGTSSVSTDGNPYQLQLMEIAA